MLIVAFPLLLLIVFVCLVFVSLIVCVLACFSLGLSCMGLFVPLGLDYFLFHVGEIFNYNFFKNFLIPFLFLFFFWDPYNLNVGAFGIVPEVSETVLSSIHYLNFILFFRSYFHHFIFSSLIHYSASDTLLLIPSRVFLISVIVLSVSISFSLILLGLC